MSTTLPHTQLLVIGGGINGAGIAADAAGRGLSVRLVEQGDLACATSSASSKLIHGGLRYLEHYEFRLVREALAERAVLLKKAPHLIFPLRFILPHSPQLRPKWMIRSGLFFYDHLTRRSQALERSRQVKFATDTNPLQDQFNEGFAYSDCWVDDARLVIANAQVIVEQGSMLHTYMRCHNIQPLQNKWQAQLTCQITGKTYQTTADIIINASGPWAQTFLEQQGNLPSPRKIRLIKGSHIITNKLYPQNHAYILQNQDRRIVFVIPYLERFSIIGTTDQEFYGDPKQVNIESTETEYLLAVYNHHFKHKIDHKDIIHSYSGARPLCDDESSDPAAITRDYTINLQQLPNHPPILTVFGGKLTTYRKLAEATLKKLYPFFPDMKPKWTHDSPLPGSEKPFAELEPHLKSHYPWLPVTIRNRWLRLYGWRSEHILKKCHNLLDLGLDFGQGFTQKELYYLLDHEWAKCVEDVLWRRTKLGLTLPKSAHSAIEKEIKQYFQ